MSTITCIQDALVDLADELAHAERLIEEQAVRIESLEAEIALLRNLIPLAGTRSSSKGGGSRTRKTSSRDLGRRDSVAASPAFGSGP